MTTRATPLAGVAGLGLLLALGLGGCGDVTVTLHEPGVYKGKTDPLLQYTNTLEHREQLRARMAQVQTDR